MNEQPYQNFHCHDGSLSAAVGVMQTNGKWALYSISKVLGMGRAEYENHILDAYYDEVVGLNSYSRLSYIATKLHNKWGLIEISDNGRVKGEWKAIADNEHDDLDEMLVKFGVRKEEYIEK